MLQRTIKKGHLGCFIHFTLIGTAFYSLASRRTLALLPRTPLCFTSRAKFFSSTMEDEFDDSFLEDFDVDAAVRDRSSNTTASLPTPSATAPLKKKFKVTPSPAVSSAALRAHSPSRFTQGTTTDPEQFFASVSDQHIPTDHPPSPLETSTSSSLTDQKALEETLETYFGYREFRPGQLQVLQAVLDNKRDAAVFWATGSGKSICYQLPDLHTNTVALVVSPLISLMQDQCNKLNGLSSKKLATFLGSAQTDIHEETAALSGKYRVVFVTPEKLLSGGFLDELARMHRAITPLSLIAIDESHCVSEWGHDFRPEYRRLHQIRSHAGLSQVPLVALTATAVPRVQQDICSSLNLRSPLIVKQSFDRSNLIIEIHKKKGMNAALDPLLPKLAQESTIIYAPTRDQVESIANFLSAKLPGQVEPYHAGLSQETRTRAHLSFLIGRTKVIVATVAFGLGIDKPDTRRVVHWGPPKTVEEYYQQIGRAGRDGLKAECLMFVSDGDFDKYKSDFYLKGLHGQAKDAMIKNVDSLRSFAMDAETCRRKALLNFFQEMPTFGDRCGTCDTCQRLAKYGEDTERDFGNLGARMVLKVIDALDHQGLSNIEKVIGGNVIESYRYKRGCDPGEVQRYIQTQRLKIGIRVPSSHFRELLTSLVTKGYVQQGSKSANINGYSRAWTTHELTTEGRNALRDESIPLVLPVTQPIREMERKAEEKRSMVLKKLENAGIRLDQLPKEEVEKGDGEVVRAFTAWHSYLGRLRKAERDDRLAECQDLLARIESWRSDAASNYLMAPAAVLAEHTMVFIAYTVATMKPGLEVEPSALVAAGVRTRELDSLVAALNGWINEVQPGTCDKANTNDDKSMIFSDAPFAPDKPWEYAVYKPLKKTGKASWESSYERFLNGEDPQAIAMSPANGRPIQTTTVVGHVLDALTQGRPVQLNRVAQFFPAPTKSEWDALEETEETTGMSVVGDPNTSGLGGEKFTLTEFLRNIMGDDFVNTPSAERNEADKATFGHWCDKLKWYMVLRRVGYEPKFSD